MTPVGYGLLKISEDPSEVAPVKSKKKWSELGVGGKTFRVGKTVGGFALLTTPSYFAERGAAGAHKANGPGALHEAQEAGEAEPFIGKPYYGY